MIVYLKRVTIRNLVSPYGLAVASCLIFLMAWVAPPALYMEYTGEPDIVHLNPIVLLFYSFCVLTFLAGVRTFDYFKRLPSTEVPAFSSSSPLAFLLLPLAVSTLLCIGALIVLNGRLSNLMGLFLSQQGALIKLAGASGQAEEGSWGYMLTFHTGVLWWAYSRAQQFSLPGLSVAIFRTCYAIALAVGLGSAVIKVDRTNLIPIIAGVLILYLYSKLARRDISITKALIICLALTIVLLSAFSAISYVRGASDARLLMVGLFGYTAASYNRLAAEVTGILHYSFGGRGIYLSSFLAFNNTVNKIISFNELMGGASQRGVYFSEFPTIAAAGLNPGFNWSGAFGYLYADLGWWTPLYLFPVGIFNGYLWRAFRLKSVVGVVLYPWAAFSILFWFGWNVLFDLRFALLLLVVAALKIYEICLLGRRAVGAPIPLAAVT